MRHVEAELHDAGSAFGAMVELSFHSRHLREAGDVIFQRDQNFREALAVRAVLQRGTLRTPVNPQHGEPEGAYEWTSPISGSTHTVVDRPMTSRQVLNREGEFFYLTNRTIELTEGLKLMEVDAKPLLEFRKK